MSNEDRSKLDSPRADRQYQSTLQRVVPFVSKPSTWYSNKDNWDLCIWCKANKRVETKFGLITWCKRCYDLHALKHDGTYAEQGFRVALAQDFDDIQQGRIKVPEKVKWDKDKIIDVDE